MDSNDKHQLELAMLEVRRASYACGFADGEPKPSGPNVRKENREQMEAATRAFDALVARIRAGTPLARVGRSTEWAKTRQRA